MAQIIKHRRGSLESLSTVVASLQKGEIVVASGSSNLTVTNGASLVFAVPENGQAQAINRFLIGDAAPKAFAPATYSGLVDGVPYYASGSQTLYLLGSDGNQAISLLGNIQPFSASVDYRLDSIEASIGGGGALASRVTSLEASQSYFDGTYSGSVNGRLVVVEGVSASSAAALNSASGAAATALGGAVSTLNGSISSLSSSAATALSASEATLTGNANSLSSSTATALSASEATLTGNINSLSSSAATALGGAVSSVNGNINSLSSSAATALSASEATLTGNINSLSSSAATSLSNLSGAVAISTKATNDAVSSLSSSVATTVNTLSSSVATSFSASDAAIVVLSASVDGRLDSLEAASPTHATTGSNIFYGTQTITGSLYITQNLVVQGSSSLQNITASAVDIGTNLVQLNTASPAIRFGGVSVQDSGSNHGVSGSLLWDSFKDRWVSVNPDGSSATLIYGPNNTGELGNEGTLTSGYIPVADTTGHIKDSIISQGEGINIAGGLVVTGNISASTITGIGNVASYSTSVDSRLVVVEAVSASSAAALNGISGAVATTISTEIGNLSGSAATALSASTATLTGNINSLSSSAATALSASEATLTGNINSLSSSAATALSGVSGAVATTISTQIGNLSGSAALALSGVSGAVATTISTEIGNLSGSTATALSSSVATLNGATTNLSSSVASTINTLSSSVDGRLVVVEAVSASSAAALNGVSGAVATTITNLSSSVASAANTLSGAVATTVSNLSSSVATSVSASNAAIVTAASASNADIVSLSSSVASTVDTLSASVDGRLDTLEGTGGIQGVGKTDSVIFGSLGVTGNAIISGDLTVNGSLTTINTNELVVKDKLITLASGSTSAAVANGAGIEIAGANASFTYNSTDNAWTSNVPYSGSAVTASINLGQAAGGSKRVAFRNTNGSLDLVPAASTVGDIVQWDGSDFVMSNVIDGGSF